MEMKIIYNKQSMFPLVEQWRKTDLKKNDYAEQHGISIATFRYWCRKHYEEVLRGRKSKFIEIDHHQIFPDVERKPQVELDLPSGLRLKIY